MRARKFIAVFRWGIHRSVHVERTFINSVWSNELSKFSADEFNLSTGSNQMSVVFPCPANRKVLIRPRRSCLFLCRCSKKKEGGDPTGRQEHILIGSQSTFGKCINTRQRLHVSQKVGEQRRSIVLSPNQRKG